MASHSQISAIAHVYAQSILALANEQQQAQEMGNDLRDLVKIVKDSPDFATYLRDPSVSAAERGERLKRIFAGKVPQLLMNFLGVLNNHHRLNELEGVAESYRELLDKQSGRIQVELRVATELDAGMLAEVQKQVSAALKKEAILTQVVDESLIGGLTLKIEDKLLDASVRTQLASMRKQLLESARGKNPAFELSSVSGQ